MAEHPEKRSIRALHDEHYVEQIKRIWQESAGRYGMRKVWQQLKQWGYSVARCTVARLMQHPNNLWVADFTYIQTNSG